MAKYREDQTEPHCVFLEFEELWRYMTSGVAEKYV